MTNKKESIPEPKNENEKALSCLKTGSPRIERSRKYSGQDRCLDTTDAHAFRQAEDKNDRFVKVISNTTKKNKNSK